MDRSISARAVARVPFRHAEQFLRRPPLGLFGDRYEGAPSNRCFRTHLSADAPGGLSVAHDVDIEVVAVHAEGDRVDVALRWQPSGGASLLPPFVGSIGAAPANEGGTELVLDGSYHVPLGPLGRFGDGVVGKRIARSSIDDLLQRITNRLEELTLESRVRPPQTSKPHPPDMRREARNGPTR